MPKVPPGFNSPRALLGAHAPTPTMGFEQAYNDAKESEEANEYDRPMLGTSAMQAGEPIQVTFRQDDADEVETEYGEAMAWDVSVTGKAQNIDSDKTDFNDGDDARLLTSSTRFIRALGDAFAEHGEGFGFEGVEVEILRTATGYDTDYNIRVIPEDKQARF